MATVITLSEACPIIYGHELPENVREDFDHIADDDLSDNMFFEIGSRFYHVGEVIKADEYAAKGFHAVYGESAFSALLIGIIDGDSDNLKVGRVCS